MAPVSIESAALPLMQPPGGKATDKDLDFLMLIQRKLLQNPNQPILERIHSPHQSSL